VTTPEQRATAALASFAATATVDGRTMEGFYRLGDSPEDQGYLVRLTLSVAYDAASKSYRCTLTVHEQRIEAGYVSERYGYGMPSRDLGTTPAPRYSAKRLATIYSDVIAALKSDRGPLLDLLREEESR